MARLAYRQSYNMSQYRSQSWTLLVQLSGAHDQLIAEMENLERLTAGPRVDNDTISTGRWRISQASLRRRTLASRIFDFLGERLDGDELVRLRNVQSADQDMMRRSARHVGNWTIRTIGEDWQAYCRASRDIRAHMKSHVEFERATLYPLLERLAERGI